MKESKVMFFQSTHYVGSSLCGPANHGRMIVKFKLLPLILCLSILNTGCASIFNGTTAHINVTSTPSGADCDLAGYGVHTPGTISIPKSSADLTVNCQKENYLPGSAPVPSTYNTTSLVNILLIYLVLIGTVVDFATGAAWDYPSHVNVNLIEKPKATSSLPVNESSKPAS